MKPFKCSTKECIGSVAPTDEGRRWYFGILRIWTCPYCERRYQVNHAAS